MCGIIGIVHFDCRPVDPDILKGMTDTLSHRGPDDEGYFVNRPLTSHGPKWKSRAGEGNVGLGHRRLSIIDLASGHQPMANADGTIWIAFNGEIYNHHLLRRELEREGFKFQTRSDTEAIVHAYEMWGERCVERLRGMFAFAIWDEKKQRLFLARDRVGKKPLYYYWSDRRFLFGSELKAILAYPETSQEIDPQALFDYFNLLYIPAPKSIFKGVRKLPAGHVMTVKAGESPRIRPYWDLKFQPDHSVSEAEWGERIREKLKECVEIRLESEVPLGAFLSGGIDSSAVVANMSGLMDSPVKTSSIGFEESGFNELPYARKVVGRYGTDHQEKVVRPDAVGILEKLVWHYDEPFADSSAIPTFYVSQLTRERVTVALSGDGGDENFAGYRRYFYDRLENRLRGVLPAVFRQTAIAAMARIYPKADWLPQVFRAKTLLTNLSLSPMEGYFNTMSWFGRDKGRILAPDLKRDLHEYSPLQIFEEYGKAADTKDPLSRIQYVDVKTYLVEDILTKVDRASMANSLEVRVPLLDHEFMELAAQIPSGMKLRGKEGKSILKKALEPIVPHDILYRPKMGFSMPLKDWLRGDLKPVFKSAVFKGRAGEFLNLSEVDSLWKGHQSGLRDFSAELWSVLFFAVWCEKMMGRSFGGER
ncbi:MAG: asparagine synthase (glutamine-hydrolyzing) [Desulfuromonadales bacterium]|nr:asparagine synthase (glutamine-hydrolyzing) [Desulfuromonadales bacterium]